MRTGRHSICRTGTPTLCGLLSLHWQCHTFTLQSAGAPEPSPAGSQHSCLEQVALAQPDTAACSLRAPVVQGYQSVGRQMVQPAGNNLFEPTSCLEAGSTRPTKIASCVRCTAVSTNGFPE